MVTGAPMLPLARSSLLGFLACGSSPAEVRRRVDRVNADLVYQHPRQTVTRRVPLVVQPTSAATKSRASTTAEISAEISSMVQADVRNTTSSATEGARTAALTVRAQRNLLRSIPSAPRGR